MYLLHIIATNSQENKSTLQTTIIQIRDLLTSCEFKYWFPDVKEGGLFSPQLFSDSVFDSAFNIVTFKSKYDLCSVTQVLTKIVQWVKKEMKQESLDLVLLPFHCSPSLMNFENSVVSSDQYKNKRKTVVLRSPESSTATTAATTAATVITVITPALLKKNKKLSSVNISLGKKPTLSFKKQKKDN